MTLIQTNDPSEFWMCLELPRSERRRHLFTGKERTRKYKTRGPLFKDKRTDSFTSIPPVPVAKPAPANVVIDRWVKYPKSGTGPVHLIRKPWEKDLAWLKRCVCFSYGVSVAEMEGPRKWQRFVDARQKYFFEARMKLKASYPQMARHCGGRDHTTALHGARNHAQKHGLILE